MVSVIDAVRAAPEFATLRRSLDVYYGDAERDRRMDGLLAGFVRDGGLAFDVGSHVGDRIASFRRLGARVVALEPQPLCQAVLHRLYDADPGVTIVGAACAATAGSVTFKINTSNPTVSTAADAFVAAAAGAEGWVGQTWDTEITVPTVTLDELIARHGEPEFIKIDVEGYEAEALAGLSRPVAALSFEFTTIQRDVAMACLKRIAALGARYRYNFALGESHSFELPDWVGAEAIGQAIAALPHAANSGDVYAVRETR